MAGSLALGLSEIASTPPFVHDDGMFARDEHWVSVNSMTLERTLVAAVRRHLEEYGVDCTVRVERSPLVGADATLALRWGASHQRFALYAMPGIRLARVLAARDESPRVLVTAPWISARMGAQLREAGVGYVDSVGNASVRFGTVLIEVSGRPRPPRPSDPSPTRTAPLLTSANRRVIAALLADPALGRATLRDLAAAAEVSLGQAHKASALLAEAGFHRDRLSDSQRDALADVLAAVDGLGT